MTCGLVLYTGLYRARTTVTKQYGYYGPSGTNDLRPGSRALLTLDQALGPWSRLKQGLGPWSRLKQGLGPRSRL